LFQGRKEISDKEERTTDWSTRFFRHDETAALRLRHARRNLKRDIWTPLDGSMSSGLVRSLRFELHSIRPLKISAASEQFYADANAQMAQSQMPGITTTILKRKENR
jgi:hypothetical protein